MSANMTHNIPINLECKYLDQYRSSTKVPVYIKKKNNFDFLEALMSKYDVLDKIFDYLSYQDLSNVAQLHEFLANSVGTVLKKRLSPVLFSLSSNCYIKPNPFDIDPSLCVLFNGLDQDVFPFQFSSYICLHGNKITERKPVIEFLEKDLISSKCPISSLSCREVSSSFVKGQNFNGIIFPPIPNVKMSVFKVSAANKKVLPLVLEENIGPDNNLVCMLIFALSMRRKSINSFVSKLHERQPGKQFALGGGFVLGMKTFNSVFQTTQICKKTDLMCISFSVPKNTEVQFNAYSLVIQEEASSLDEIEKYLEKLRSTYIPRKFGIAFRITCVSRQEEVSKEMELLKKLFPDIEVLGFNGDGEIGWNCFNNCDNTEECSQKKIKLDPDKNCLHELTTIIVLLTWGKRKI